MRQHSIEAKLASYFEEPGREAVLLAYLFGSEGAGRPHGESDVDVAVLLDRAVLPSTRERFDYRVQLTSDLIGRLHRNEVDVLVLNEAPPLLGRRIANEGRCVFCRRSAVRHDFERDVRLRAADLAPFVERARRRLLERLGS